MKTLEQADREARKAGVLTMVGRMRSLDMGEYEVEYFGNGGDTPQDLATNFYVRRKGMQDDYASDHFAGWFCRTLTAAIRAARKAGNYQAERMRPSQCDPLNDPSSLLQGRPAGSARQGGAL